MSAPERPYLDGPVTWRVRGRCPDGGTCHHECGEACWRVGNAAPLAPHQDWGDVGPAETWEDKSPYPHTAKGSMTPTELRTLRQYLGVGSGELSRMLGIPETLGDFIAGCEEGRFRITRMVEYSIRYLVTCENLVDMYEEEE